MILIKNVITSSMTAIDEMLSPGGMSSVDQKIGRVSLDWLFGKAFPHKQEVGNKQI